MFRLKLSPAAVPSHPASASAAPFKVLALFALFLVGMGVVAGWLLARRDVRNGDALPDTGPILLAIQNKGQLHTVAYNWKDVFHQDSENEPASWATSIPGATGLYHWATHNRVLVSANGVVEAGVDLSALSEKDITKTKRADGMTLVRVHLPPVTIYPPNVHIRVENDDPGPLWRDENIVPKAQEQASYRLLEAAEKDNIRAKAEENAIKTLDQTQRSLGNKDVEVQFTFDPPGKD